VILPPLGFPGTDHCYFAMVYFARNTKNVS
jgi:hypothetical protein